MNKESAANAQQYLNLLFNPFETENIPKSPGDTKLTTALKHGAGLTVGYGGLAMVLRYLKDLKERSEVTTDTEKMRSYIEAKNPILSLDGSTRDAKRERKEKDIGVQEVTSMPGISKTASAVGGMTSKDVSWMHPAIALAAMIGGGYGGYKLMDRKLDRQKNNEIQDEIEENENKIDKLLYEEYKRTRGLDKMAYTLGDAASDVKGRSNTEAATDAMFSPAKVGRMGASLYGIAALGLLTLAYKSSKDYMDENDPNRQRMSQLRKILDEKGKVRSAPKFADLSKLPKATGSAPKSSASAGVSLQRKSDNKNPIKDSKAAVDETDPYAELVAQG
jgi:hypothetical protein